MEKVDKKTKEVIERIKKSLGKQIAISEKYGFNIKKHWLDMQKTLKK